MSYDTAVSMFAVFVLIAILATPFDKNTVAGKVRKFLFCLLGEMVGAIVVVFVVVICVFACVVAFACIAVIGAIAVPVGAYLLSDYVLNSHTKESK